ncbi:MAG: Na+/H+ antiporter NhaA [Slackia sp.]
MPQVIPPATRLENKLYPWVYFLGLPLFALTNADVHLAGVDPSMLFGDTVFMGVFFGLLLGKPIGIMLFSFVVVKTKLASLPTNVSWIHMIGAAILGGVGFTMAIFVANLAYATRRTSPWQRPLFCAHLRLPVLSDSPSCSLKQRPTRNAVFCTVTSPEGADSATFADAEARRASEGIIDTFGEEDQVEVQEAFEDRDNREVAVQLNPEELKKG